MCIRDRDEHVGLVQQDEHERQPTLLAAGQVAHRLVLVIFGEPEPFEQLPRCHLLAVEHRAPRVARDHLAHAVVAELAQLVQMLRQHGETHGLADFHAPGIERLQPLSLIHISSSRTSRGNRSENERHRTSSPSSIRTCRILTNLRTFVCYNQPRREHTPSAFTPPRC